MKKGFTLVELVVVVAIIGVVVSLVAAAVISGRINAAEKEAESTLDQLALALMAMKDYYRYDDLLGKDHAGSLVPEAVKIDLELDPYNEAYGWNGTDINPEWGGWRPHLNMRTDPQNPERKICKRFYEAKRRRIVNCRLVDPWGTPYVYDIITRSRDLNGDGKLTVIDVERLYSCGPDCILDTEDDIMREPDRRVRLEGGE